MFYQFTEVASHALQNASKFADERGHTYVGTAHILFGILLDGQAIPAKALANLGVNVSAFCTEIEQSLRASKDYETLELLTSPPPSKRAILLAFELVTGMKGTLVDCEHLLLGLLQEGDGLAAQLLHNHGVTFDALNNEIARLRADGS